MTTATISGQEMFSLGHVCAMTRRGPNAIVRVAKGIGILPVVSLNGVAYFNADDCDAIADKFRQMDAEQKAKDEAAAKEAARPRSLKELSAERKKILGKYPAGFKPDKQWLRETIDGSRLVEINSKIEALIESGGK